MDGSAKNRCKLVTVNEVAELCGVSPTTVRRLADRGATPPTVSLGRLVKFQKAQIEKWIADGCPDMRRGRR